MFYLAVISFLGGVMLTSIATPPLFFITALGILIVLALSFGFIDRRLFLIALIFTCFLIGIMRVNMVHHEPILKSGTYVSMRVTVIEEPDVREFSTQLTVDLKQTGERAILVVNQFPEYHYGDVLWVNGVVEYPKNFTTNGEREFDYVHYLAKDGVYYIVNKPKITLVGSGAGNSVQATLFTFKSVFMKHLRLIIPEPASSFAGGLLLGTKQSLGKTLLADFQRAGVIHVVVLSGYNVTIVAEAVAATLSFLPRLFAGSVGIIGIVAFAALVGGSASIIRASIMAVLVIVARLFYRDYNITRALLFAGVVMVFLNPMILAFDISFQLSFLATLGLIIVAPHFDRFFHFVPETLGLREVVVATLATQIFVLPILLYNMGQLSFVALPANLLILSAIPLTMLFSFVTGVLMFVNTQLAIIPGFISYLLLTYELNIVTFFASLPFAAVTLPVFSAWFMVFAYAAYGFILWWFNKKVQ